MNINWEDLSLQHGDEVLNFPNSFAVPMIYKFQLRKMYSDDKTGYRLIAHNQKSTRTRPLTRAHYLHESTMRLANSQEIQVIERSFLRFDTIEIAEIPPVSNTSTCLATIEEEPAAQENENRPV